MSRDSQTDASRDGSDQKRLSDPDVMAVDPGPWCLADEKNYDPDSIGTASDYRGTTAGARRRYGQTYINESNFYDEDNTR